MKVEELMTKRVKSCRSDDSLAYAARIMWENDCGCVPVVDEAARVVGIVTDRDGVMAAYTQGKALEAIPVATAMARKVLTSHPDDTIEAAEKTLSGAQIRRLPVVDARGRLVGILSLNDVARRTTPNGKQRPDGLSPDSVAHTLAAISAPHAPS